MRIAAVTVDTVVVPFREPVDTGAGRWERRRLGLLSLRTDSGLIGLGEYAAPEPDDLGEEASGRLVATLDGLDLGDPVHLERTLRSMDAWPFVGRVARAAAESAIVDLRAAAEGLSVAASLAAAPTPDVAVNGLIGAVEPPVAESSARALVRQGVGTLKLKAGREPRGALVERLGAVRAALGPDVRLRVDFNGALDRATAAAVLADIAPFGLEYVEQPIPAAAGPAALAELRAATPVPIAAAEAVRDLGSVRALMAAEAVDALVVKPSRVGGLRQARSIVELAVAAGVPVTVSTLFESGVGLAGALHLAASTPGTQAHGLATADVLESDLLERPLSITQGRMAVPTSPGLGIDLDPTAIERYRAA